MWRVRNGHSCFVLTSYNLIKQVWVGLLGVENTAKEERFCLGGGGEVEIEFSYIFLVFENRQFKIFRPLNILCIISRCTMQTCHKCINMFLFLRTCISAT